MRGQHDRGLSWPDRPALDLKATRHLDALLAWRRRSPEEQWLALGGDETPFAPGIEPARDRVRLGLFCPCLGLGGAESWQLALADAVDLDAVVWRGAVVTEGRRSVAPAMLGELSRRMPVGFGLGAARALAEVSDVILSWSVLDHDALFRGLPQPPRVALACHFPAERRWTPVAEQLLSRVDRLVAVSELAVESLPPALQDRATIIWNAVDPARLEPTQTAAQTRAGWSVPPGARVAGYLGRLAAEKDPAAMLRLAEHLPDPWYVVLVGDGHEEAALRQTIAERGLDRVRLIPGTVAVGDTLAAFDSLVVPSRFESFGLTMAEGFWAGVPVVATRVGLARLVPGLAREVGFVPAGDELADAVRADHREAASATRRRVSFARQFARERLGITRFGRDWTELCQRLATSTANFSSEGEPCRSNLVG